MTNLDSILKSRGINFLTKVCIIKAMVFPVVMNGYVDYTTKKAEPATGHAVGLMSRRQHRVE